MLGTWLQDLESLEEISQDLETRRICLRMAELQRAGRIASFLVELRDDPGIDDDTKGTIVELAQEPGFLLAVEEYCFNTDRLH